MNILNIFSILSIDFFLSFLYIYVVIFPFLLPLLSLCLLYFVWFLVDMFKHKKCKIEQNKIENFAKRNHDDCHCYHCNIIKAHTLNYAERFELGATR